MPSKILAFRMQPQKNTKWCWAAVTSSISKHYWKSSLWTQCRVVSNSLKESSCCDMNLPSFCNVPWALDYALRITDNLKAHWNYWVAFPVIVREINNGRIIGARIAWSNGTGHFIAIVGYLDSEEEKFYAVDDPRPKSPKSILIEESRLINNYQGSGKWSDTYITQKPSKRNMIRFTYVDRQLLKRANKHVGVMFPKRQRRFNWSELTNTNILLPHFVYEIPFNSLKSKDHNMKAISFRIVNSEELLIIDVDRNSEEAKIQEIIYDQQYVKDYIDLLFYVIDMGMNRPASFSISFVIQAELNYSAFCLKNIDSPQENLFISFDPNAEKTFLSYSETEYFNMLENFAQDSNSYEDNFGG
ncbi:papain-like cysteine protease family protein [Flavobacterium sp. Root420]|uniref:papain-like cysteine protease family protein n=1 Tax=Flavobacterium sp. Root420 TaxID=1736533 RepID=UPI0006FDD738|nr:papain-like cysteine protease family protein [Flavobacterium sp. Root420]KQX00774.1 hypothetical protein ASC72_07885 [Flavobacterium sp. Root420]